MIAIVCGGNDYTDCDRLAKVLDGAVSRLRLDTVIEGHGGEFGPDGKVARGADLLAREWAMARGDVSVIDVPADWRTYDKAAGPIRNRLMLAILIAGGSAVERAVIAFPGGKGTANMVDLATSAKARAAGVKLYEIPEASAP